MPPSPGVILGCLSHRLAHIYSILRGFLHLRRSQRLKGLNKYHMPTPRKSLSQLAASGTLGRNKGRYESRIAALPNFIRPVGKAPPHLPPVERAVWAEIVRGAPDGLLQRSDRLIVEVLSRLVVRMRTSNPKSSELNAVVNVLGKMGLTPADRSKLNLESPPDPSVKSEQDARWAELDELD